MRLSLSFACKLQMRCVVYSTRVRIRLRCASLSILSGIRYQSFFCFATRLVFYGCLCFLQQFGDGFHDLLVFYAYSASISTRIFKPDRSGAEAESMVYIGCYRSSILNGWVDFEFWENRSQNPIYSFEKSMLLK